MSILVLVYTILYNCLSNEIDFVVMATQILSSTIQGLRSGRDLSTLGIFFMPVVPCLPNQPMLL